MRLAISKGLVIAVAMASWLAPAVQAATTVYTDRAAFDLATGANLTLEDFNDRSLDGFTLTSNSAQIIRNSTLRDRPTAAGATTTYNFGSGISAFGADFDLSPGGSGNGLRFVLSTGEIVSQELSAPYVGFWGFVSDTFFTSVRVEAGSGPGIAETHNVDNFSFGIADPVAPIPLPAGLPLLFSALLAAFGWRFLGRRSFAQTVNRLAD